MYKNERKSEPLTTSQECNKETMCGTSTIPIFDASCIQIGSTRHQHLGISSPPSGTGADD
jgi:hypothetical protein